jgi:hypothetical protein
MELEELTNSNASGHTISFQIKGEYKPVNNIPIDQIGSYVLFINPEDHNMKVIYEV